MDEWKSALESVKKNPKREIFDMLKVSYDGLEEMWKYIFLDIACFFRGKAKDRVVEILENCGLDARIGMSVLMHKSLITIENNKLCMHGLLQEMGREIVRQDSRGKPEKRSRLWLLEDLFYVLTKNTVRTVAKIKFYFEMGNLRLLIVDNMSILNGLNHLPNDLRFLDWFGYSSKLLRSNFQPKVLVKLNLQFSEIKYLWEGVKVEQYLEKTGIKTLPSSIKCLTALTSLNLEDCLDLNCLPSNMNGLISLEKLILTGCFYLYDLPESIWKIECLKELELIGTSIWKLPSANDVWNDRLKEQFVPNILAINGLLRGKTEFLTIIPGYGIPSLIEVVFENYGSIREEMHCGVGLVYEQDVEEFNQKIAQTGESPCLYGLNGVEILE
ncbi:hypothetical protein SO802_021272 [Lithocarpus litseifolius]|uniref:Disease resistance protein Roq1-like winged-helix domain-containing protein n=1 Tax=Lithocarpus litseifolius TaxID=425828 RepID=A0AAW2CEH4_9ROSI